MAGDDSGIRVETLSCAHGVKYVRGVNRCGVCDGGPSLLTRPEPVEERRHREVLDALGAILAELKRRPHGR